MRVIYLLSLLTILICHTTTAYDQAPETLLDSQQLLDAQQSWDGGNIAYPKGKPNIISLRVTASENEVIEYHCHPVPTLAYLIKGTMSLETIKGKKRIIHAGESMVEAMRTMHRGHVVEGPVEIIVFHVGSDKFPNTIALNEHNDKTACQL